MKLRKDYSDDVVGQFSFLVIFVLIMFGVIVGRVAYLQILRGDEYRLFSAENSIKDIRQPAARGLIRDRNGEVMVGNRPSFNIMVIPQYVKDRDRLATILAESTGVARDEIVSKLEQTKRAPKYVPLPIVEDASLDMVSAIKARRMPGEGADDLAAVDVQLAFARDYKDGTLAPHVIGYLREIGEEEIKSLSDQYPGKYRMHDMIGATGIERNWDQYLKGQDGLEQVVVSAVGRVIHQPSLEDRLHKVPSLTGDDLHLTLDARLQREANRLLDGRSGSVVAIDPRDGAIRVMVSNPRYDLGLLNGEGRKKYWQHVALAPERILYHRALQAMYPPGSIYKLVMAAAVLSENEMSPTDRVTCGGGLMFGGRRFGCWNKAGHGSVSLVEAISGSCDVYFYKAGIALGVDRIAKYAHLFGLGEKTGIDLPNESSGLIPTSEWKERVKKEKWNPGETLSIAIGQGYDLMTPLQAAVMTSVVANGGRRIQPHLMERVVDRHGKTVINWEPTLEADTGISPEILKLVKEGMIRVVEGGTARRLSALNLKIAGKTGTAQVASLGKENKGDHAWFVGLAPYDNPELVIAVMVEHGGGGSATAAPVAGALFEAYFKGASTEMGETDEY